MAMNHGDHFLSQDGRAPAKRREPYSPFAKNNFRVESGLFTQSIARRVDRSDANVMAIYTIILIIIRLIGRGSWGVKL